MKIRHQLLTSSGVLVGLIVVLAWAQVQSIISYDINQTRMQSAYEKVDCIRRLFSTLVKQGKEVSDIVLLGKNPDKLFESTKQIYSCLDTLEQAARQKIELSPDENAKKEYEIINKISSAYTSNIANLRSKLKKVDKEQKLIIAEEMEEFIHRKISPLIDISIELQKTEIDQLISRQKSKHSASTITSVIIIAVSTITAFLLAIRVSRSIARPICSLTDATNQIRAGNWDISIEGKFKGEVKVLVESFLNMAKQLKESMITIDRLNDEIDRNKKLEEALRSSNQELAQFAHVASHDLREPIRKIRSFAGLLNNSLRDKLNEDDTENMNFVLEGAARMDQLVQALLLYSKFENPQKEYFQVDLNRVVELLKEDELADVLDQTNGKVVIPGALPLVWGEPVLLRQILFHLIDNGLKYHRPSIPPRIEIRAVNLDDYRVRIEVRDNGMGIGKEYFKEIFKMFKTVNKKISQGSPGIGLALCKRFVAKQGGEMGVESSPGQGSTFWFTAHTKHESIMAQQTALIMAKLQQ